MMQDANFHSYIAREVCNATGPFHICYRLLDRLCEFSNVDFQNGIEER